MDTLAAMPVEDRGEMLNYINDYCAEKLKYDTAECKFELSSEEELKYLLYGIEQRFYTTREGANKRGNSSRLTQSFHFFMFEPIFSPVNALNQPI